MNELIVWAAPITPVPTPTLREGLNPLDVSPGVLGFVFTFFLAVALILLGLSMTRRMRRIRYQAEQQEEVNATPAVPSALADDAVAPAMKEEESTDLGSTASEE